MSASAHCLPIAGRYVIEVAWRRRYDAMALDSDIATWRSWANKRATMLASRLDGWISAAVAAKLQRCAGGSCGNSAMPARPADDPAR
jgi:hypothetical protein